MDLRPQLSWPQRLPGRLGTAALWLGSCSLLGPAKLAVLLLAGSLMAPCLLLLERHRPQATSAGAAVGIQTVAALPVAGARPQATPLPAPAGLARAALAAQLGLPESQLFRARHAALCTVHHDDEGRIVALELPLERSLERAGAALPLSLPSSDAHPVG